jgi:hypothetical protein
VRNTHKTMLLRFSLRAMTVLSYCNRAAIFLVGMFLAFIFFFANAMLSDSGKPIAKCASTFGLLACLLFAGGGCFGLVTGSWSTLLPGLVAQVAALGFRSLLEFLDHKIPGLHRAPDDDDEENDGDEDEGTKDTRQWPSVK